MLTPVQRRTYSRRLSGAAVTCLILYLLLLIAYYPGAYDLENNLATAAAAAAAAALVLTPPARPGRVWLFAGSLAAFYGLNLLSVHLAPGLPGMGHSSSRWVHLPGILFCLAAGLGARDRKSAGLLLFFLLTVSLLWYSWEAIGHLWRGPYLDQRLIASRGFHTVLAMELLVLCSLYLAAAALARERRLAFLAAAGAGLVGILLFMTKTRFALLTLVLVTVPAAILLQTRLGTWRQRLATVLVWVLVLAPGAGAVWYYQASPERRSSTNVNLRLEAWQTCIRIAAKAPRYRWFIGHGSFSRTFDGVSRYYFPDSPKTFGERFYHAHSIVFQTFLETGLLGLTALALLWVMALRGSLSAWRRRAEPFPEVPGILVIALITLAAMGQMDYLLQGVPDRLFWFTIGLGFAAGGEDEDEVAPGEGQPVSGSSG